MKARSKVGVQGIKNGFGQVKESVYIACKALLYKFLKINGEIVIRVGLATLRFVLCFFPVE
jgi:hypothetical protein